MNKCHSHNVIRAYERGHPVGHKGENRQCWLQDTFKCLNQHPGRPGWHETVLLLLL